MAEENIKCPYCSKDIPLTEALSSRIKEGLRKEYEERTKARELELKRREEELKAREREAEESIQRRLNLEKARILQDAQKKARDEVQVALKDLQEENARKERLLADARGQELELRRKTRELEEGKKALDIEVARRIDSERDRIRRQTLDMFMEEHRLKDMEKDKKISDMLRTIEELKRKAEQGSMQTQGEVLEEDLEALLRARFPVDVIEPVPKGIKGADVVQKVYTRTGQYCGSIAWESKRTKAWNDEWITKLKDDQREVKAEAAVIVTEALPRGTTNFAQVEGVWVTGVGLALCLAEALRAGLIQVAQTRLSSVGKGEKMEAIYNYLSGSEFRQKIEAIAESFRSMREDLEQEKRAMTRIWAKREKQIERVVTNTVKMYGEMQGIITLPEIKTLELSDGEGGSGGPEPEDDKY